MIDYGDVPTWGTFLVAASAAVVALRQYRKQCESEDRARQREEEERQRERMEFASQLSAWIVKEKTGEDPRFGLLIQNASPISFHSLRVRMRLHGTEQEYAQVVVPPGRCVVHRSPDGGKFPWDFALGVNDDGFAQLNPITASSKYRVTGMTFDDALGQSWSVDEGGRLSLTETR